MDKIKPVVQADIDAAQAFLKHGIIDLIARPTTEAFAAHRLAAYEAGVRAGLEAAAKVADERRRYFVSGPDVRQYVKFAATEAGDAIRAIDPSSIEQGGGV